MARAVLEIDGDTSGLVAAFGAAKKAAEDAERAAKRSGGAYRESARNAAAAERAVVTEAQRAVAASVRAEQQRTRAARMSAEARKRAEEDATRVAREEARKRGLSSEQEARVKQNALERYTRLYEQEERRQTAAAEREANKRRQAWQRSFNEWRRGVEQGHREERRTVERAATVAGSAAGGAAGFVGSAAGMIRDARATRAGAERSIGNALYQAGGGRADVTAAMQTVTQFAQREGISTDTVASAMQAAQTEFSVFGDARTSATDRQARLTAFLDNVKLARNTGNDEAEFARLAGLFSSQGFDPGLQRQLLLYSAGAAQRGAVEVGAITRQSMPAITARMGLAMSAARASGGDPQQAAVREFREAMAELEVVRGTQGATPRDAGNAIRNVTQSLRGNVTQDRLRTNIVTALGQNSALEQQLYEEDPTRRGQKRLRAQYTNALDLVAAFGEQHLNADQFMNITRGGGHGNPLSLLSNERRVLGNLLNADAQGSTGIQRIRDIRDPSASLTEADVTRGAGVFGGDEQARLARLEETRLNALTTNTESIERLTHAVDGFAARNPIATAGATLGVGALVTTVGAKMTAAGGAALLAGENNRALLTGRDIGGRQLSVGERAFRGASLLLAGTVAGPVGALAAGALAGGRDVAGAVPRGVANEALTMVTRALTDLNATLRGGITANVSPVDAAHAAAAAPAPEAPAR